jgi:hypothetical protein
MTNNIILEGPQGRRAVLAGFSYKLLPGERIVGSERGEALNKDNEKLIALAAERGVGVGDLVAKLTKAFGIKPCSGCEQRRKVLNRLRINNWKIRLDKER